jgi:inner membrane transporter RhtA
VERETEVAVLESGAIAAPEQAVSDTPTGRSIVAPLFALASMTSVQLGAGLSRPLMEVLGPMGTTWLRLSFAAVILAVISRPRVFSYTAAQWRAAVLLGVVMAAMTLCYFQAITRIPLGLATSIDFLGPLAVAAFGMRRLRHLVWPVLALIGVVLLVRDRAGWTVDLVGAGFALCAAAGWASYIILMKRVGSAFSGLEGLSMSFIAAAIASAPFGFHQAAAGVTPLHAAAAAGLAVLVPLLPFALEMNALRRMSTRTFGVLMSAEPAIGAIVGMIVLGQHLSLLQWTGLLCVTAASIGAVAEK